MRPKLSTVFLFGCCVFPVWKIAAQEDKQCSVLYFHEGLQGPSVRLNDDERISDLSDLRYHYSRGADETNQNANQTTSAAPSFGSFQVKPGCTLRLSAKPYLQDNVWDFTENNSKMDTFTPNSAACSCPKVCRCEDNRLRRSECGRAYLGGDCTDCNTVFTSLKPETRWKSLPPAWTPHVRTLLLREGCDITVKLDQAGQHTLSSKTHGTIHKLEEGTNITEYRCECSEYVIPTRTEQTNTNYPRLIDIPKSKGSINTLLFSPDMKNHPGLMAALQSIRNKRSSRNAYILLLGMTGSGKSSAVNLLFDHPNITKTGDYVSTTSDIIEFSIPVPVPELGMKNTGLHVIDTPGIGDTRGITEDARFLASLDDYLSKHEDLKRNLPNVVLIFAKFSDNRFHGDGSGFVKMLRTLDLFKDKIIDKKSTNVIFVLTHYMSETKTVQKDPSARVNAIRKVIQEFSTLPRPIHIILAENKPDELLSINGFSVLPNGDLYPKNLFDQMQRSLHADPVGDVIIKTAFANSDNFQISGKRHRLLHKTHSKVTKYLGSLAAFNIPVTGTEVATSLNQAYASMDSSLKSEYPDALNTLQRSLYLRSIFQHSDLPTTLPDKMKLLENIHLNPVTLSLLKSALNITVPEFKANYVVGSGYSLVSDSVLPAKVFQTDSVPEQPTDLLFRMSDAYEIAPLNQMDSIFQVFRSKEEFVNGRMATLGLQQNSVPLNSYEAPVTQHPGFNLVSLSDGDAVNWNSISASLDYHTFQIGLGKNVKLSPEFTSVLGQLEKVNITDPVNVQSWQQFFNRFGTHVVTNAYGGGSVRVQASLEPTASTSSMSNSDKFNILSETMGNIMQDLANELIGKDATYIPPSGVTYQFSQYGGDSNTFWSNFSDLDDPKSIDDWKDSLKYEPVVLTSRLQLIPISEIVKKMDSSPEKGFMIEEAAASLLNASLVYIPVTYTAYDNDDFEARDRLASENGHRQATGDFESMKEIASVFEMINQSNKQMQEEMTRAMAESQRRQEQEEASYQQQMLLIRQQEIEAEKQRKQDEREEREWEFRREELRLQREAQENTLKMQMEQSRMQVEAQQRIQMEEIRSKSEQMMMQFIDSENNRRTQIALSQKPWYDKLLDSFDKQTQTATQMLPALMMMGG